MTHDAPLILLAAVVTLVGKIVWDWLKVRRNGNGTSGHQPVTFWENKFDKLAERNEKAFENALRIMIVPVMNKTNDILERNDVRQEKLTEAIIALRLRDEAREEYRRAKGMNA